MRLDLNWWRICVILSLSASSTTVVQSGEKGERPHVRPEHEWAAGGRTEVFIGKLGGLLVSLLGRAVAAGVVQLSAYEARSTLLRWACNEQPQPVS
jgi:hypothetical protein